MFRELDGEAVLLDLQSERYYGLNELGTRIWQLITDNGDLSFVYEQLLDEYEVEPQVLAQDMDRLLAQLAEFGLLSIESNPNLESSSP
jgi:Coenzyme PQQ synthesis protein D (PqqD)